MVVWLLWQGGPKAAMNARADSREAGLGDSSEAKLGGITSNLLEVGSEERLPGCGYAGCRVRGRHSVVEEVGEAGCGSAGCQGEGDWDQET